MTPLTVTDGLPRIVASLKYPLIKQDIRGENVNIVVHTQSVRVPRHSETGSLGTPVVFRCQLGAHFSTVITILNLERDRCELSPQHALQP